MVILVNKTGQTIIGTEMTKQWQRDEMCFLGNKYLEE